MSPFQVSLTHPLVKIGTFLFKAIQHATCQRNALTRNLKRQIEKQGQIRLHMPMHPMLQGQKLAPVQPTTTTLVGKGCVAETITNNPFATGKCRFDQAGKMLTTCGKHQQGFGFEMHRFIEQQCPQLFAEFRTARFPRDMHHPATGSQMFGKPFNMTTFTGTVDAFESDEFTFHFPPL